MPDWSFRGGANRYDTMGEVVSGSHGTSVTSGLTNVKGSWTEIVASTPFMACCFTILFSGVTAGDFLFDIGFGANPNEVAFVSNLHHSDRQSGQGPTSVYWFPIPIPAGTRVTVRSQCQSGGSKVGYVTIILCEAQFVREPALSRATVYGAATGDSGLVGLDPGGTADTKNSYSEIVASTTYPIRELYIVLGNQANTARTDCNWLIDISVGASLSEQIVIPDVYVSCNAVGDLVLPEVIGPIPVNIPAGSRLAARCACSIIDATDRLVDVGIIGVD